MGEAHRLEHASLLSTTHVRFNHAVLKGENKVEKYRLIEQCFFSLQFPYISRWPRFSTYFGRLRLDFLVLKIF